jgi:hypothetical protein
MSSNQSSAAPAAKKNSIMDTIFKAFSRGEEPAAPVEISTPYNFKHLQHVQIDARTSTGFSVSMQWCISIVLK